MWAEQSISAGNPPVRLSAPQTPEVAAPHVQRRPRRRSPGQHPPRACTRSAPRGRQLPARRPVAGLLRHRHAAGQHLRAGRLRRRTVAALLRPRVRLGVDPDHPDRAGAGLRRAAAGDGRGPPPSAARGLVAADDLVGALPRDRSHPLPGQRSWHGHRDRAARGRSLADGLRPGGAAQVAPSVHRPPGARQPGSGDPGVRGRRHRDGRPGRLVDGALRLHDQLDRGQQSRAERHAGRHRQVRWHRRGALAALGALPRRSVRGRGGPPVRLPAVPAAEAHPLPVRGRRGPRPYPAAGVRRPRLPGLLRHPAGQGRDLGHR